ncbi:MAG: hypothetical protein AAFV53_43115 [Myxococcota bacterium]
MMNWPWLIQWRWGQRSFWLHWSLPIGAALAGLTYQSSDAVLAYLLIIGAHLGGHALQARRRGLTVRGFEINGLGGSTKIAGPISAWGASAVGSGGVLGQLLLWLMVSLLAASLDWSTESSVFYAGLTQMNLVIALLNLIPLQGTDGYAIWSLPGAALQRLGEQLNSFEMEARQAQRAEWQTILNATNDRDSFRSVRSSASHATSDTQTLDALRAQVEADLVERDARADAGIPTETAQLAEQLLDSVWNDNKE